MMADHGGDFEADCSRKRYVIFYFLFPLFADVFLCYFFFLSYFAFIFYVSRYVKLVPFFYELLKVSCIL